MQCTHTRTQAHTYVCTQAHTYVHTCTHAHTHTHTHKYSTIEYPGSVLIVELPTHIHSIDIPLHCKMLTWSIYYPTVKDLAYSSKTTIPTNQPFLPHHRHLGYQLYSNHMGASFAHYPLLVTVPAVHVYFSLLKKQNNILHIT